MRTRGRAQPAHQTAPSIPFKPRSRLLSQKRKADPGCNLKRAPDAPPEPGHVLNAYWQKGELTLVMPSTSNPNGVQSRRLVAEHSCFVSLADLDDVDKFHRMLKSHHAVRKVLIEGPWLRIAWTGRDTCKAYCKSLTEKGIPTFEGMINPVLRHMVDNDLKPATPRKVWFDLETDSRVPFSRMEETRILSWATEDEFGNKQSSILKANSDQREKELVADLWDVLDNYDLVAAWGGDRFDFPVLQARSKLHQLLAAQRRDWRRWLWLDQLALYRRMNTAAESGEEKVSLKLDVVAMALLGTGKHEFDSSKTWEAWAAGGEARARLLAYNEQDTALMPRIEGKTGYIAILHDLGAACGTFSDSRGINPSVQVEGFLQKLAKTTDHKFPTVLKRNVGDKYEGAYVLHPTDFGILRDIHVADFAGLYPNIIRTWNMSPETLLHEDRGEHSALSPLTKERFTTSTVGVLPQAVKSLQELRKEWNIKKGNLTPGTDAWVDADRKSTAYKVAANSFYGVIGSGNSRFYSRRVAESVAMSGKWLILETMKAAELRGMKVIYVDTDSVFVQGATRAEFEKFVQWCNEDLYPRILREVGCVGNEINLAYEKQFNRLIFTTAKRYIGNYVHYKGTTATADSAPEIKGLEFKRGDAMRLIRRMQEEVIYMLMGYQCEASENPADFEVVLDRWVYMVLHGPFELADVLVSKKLNKNLKDYVANQPMVRVAKLLYERGRDVAEGAKIDYVVIDAMASPQTVIPAEDWNPDDNQINRAALWDKHIFPPTLRLLEKAFQEHDWSKYERLRPKTVRKKRAKKVSTGGEKT